MGFTVKPQGNHPWVASRMARYREMKTAAGIKDSGPSSSGQSLSVYSDFDSPHFLANDPDIRGLTSTMIYRVGCARFTSLERAKNVADLVSGVVSIDGGGSVVYAGPKPPEIPRCGRPC